MFIGYPDIKDRLPTPILSWGVKGGGPRKLSNKVSVTMKWCIISVNDSTLTTSLYPIIKCRAINNSWQW